MNDLWVARTNTVGFQDLDKVRSGQRTLMYMCGGNYIEGTTFGATRWADRTVLICEVISVRITRLLDDLTPENLRAIGFTGDDFRAAITEYERRWNRIHHQRPPFRSNPEVQRIEFRFTGEQKLRHYLSIIEEEDANVFRMIDEAASAISLETDKEVFSQKM